MDRTISCAVDLSGPYASFAASDGQNVLFAESFLLQSRKNALFFEKFFNHLEEERISVNSISRWFVGTGPGSFTGLRIASAFVSGVIYGTKADAIGIPSAFPIAVESGLKSGEKLAVLFYSAKDTLAVYSIKNNNGNFLQHEVLQELNKENSDIIKQYDKVVFLDNKNIDDFINEHYADNMINVMKLSFFPIKHMLTNNWQLTTEINDLLYVRPPSVIVN